MAARLRTRLLAACRHRLRGIDPDDLVQEALLGVHKAVIASAGEAVRGLEGLAMRILRARRADHLRRPRMVSCDPDALAARFVEEVTTYRTELRPSVRDRFRGRLQRAICDGILEGRSLQHLADRLAVPVKELRRVVQGMLETLRRSAPCKSVG